jgi:RimJ/RimL family protein N-acetyltransferase
MVPPNHKAVWREGEGETVMPSKLLQGEKVRLTALNDSDVEAMTRWYQDTAFMRLFDASPAYPKTEEEVKNRIEELRRDENTLVFAIRAVQGDELVGYLELDGINWQHGVCGLGLGIGDPAHRGKGYGSEAARLALTFAFDELNLHRVQATAFGYNGRSIALLEKMGFRREGAFREFLQRDGQRHDMILYGVLRREWASD